VTRAVFADSAYWIAIINPHDQWHSLAMQAKKNLGDARLVTTDAVLTEFLTSFSAYGYHFRKLVVSAVRKIMNNPNINFIPQTRTLFLEGLERYDIQANTKYSLQDSMSMVIMRRESITEILTSDHDFEQEGFVILMKSR